MWYLDINRNAYRAMVQKNVSISTLPLPAPCSRRARAVKKLYGAQKLLARMS